MPRHTLKRDGEHRHTVITATYGPLRGRRLTLHGLGAACPCDRREIFREDVEIPLSTGDPIPPIRGV
jgi:hypothetical protein